MKANQAKWYQLQEFVASWLKEIDPHARSTKASGGSTEKGDVHNNCGLHLEMKDYDKDSVYQEKWMQKVIEEVPFHIKRLPVLFTRNKNGKIRAHLDGKEFIDLYIEHYKMKQILENISGK